MSAIVTGRKHFDPEPGRTYAAFVDMSGGSSDDAVLAIAHYDATIKRSVLDLLVAQTGKPPFNPRDAVRKFAALLKTYGLARVHGDAYAGQTFRADFGEHGIAYEVAMLPKTGIYDALEPKLNAGEVELLDTTELQEQLLTLIVRSGRIDHQPGDHDDYANAAAGALWLVAGTGNAAVIAAPIIVTGGYGGPACRPERAHGRQYDPGAGRWRGRDRGCIRRSARRCAEMRRGCCRPAGRSGRWRGLASVTCATTAWAALINISSVTRLACVASTVAGHETAASKLL
jgi:hypothetical protein